MLRSSHFSQDIASQILKMTKKRLVGIPDDILKNFEEKITCQIMNKIEEIISTKFKEIFSHESEINTFVLKNEIALLNANSHYL